ncbi:ParA family protein [Crocosphaera chwakensis]|uniref:AAA domain-containing protein n=1 Tax=Crocosphaera chwakensis CCY0110 TaxID=391612 RepID=A3IY50_9CHRO|nr:ParA family protein [Crocosphaera chwakensis]EAZ88626.1 hypothetical protein CY0110_31515 [Crocosphaera chwakensis CCY0110]
MIKITFLSLSGGQGKSTCSLFTAKRLSKNSPVLTIDVDPQASLTSYLGHNVQPTEPTLLEVLKGTVDPTDGIYTLNDNTFLMPADDGLETAIEYLASTGLGVSMLKTIIEPLEETFSYAIIDAPPQKTQLSRTAMGAADYLVIPVETSVKGCASLVRTLETYQELKRWKGTTAEILGIIPFRDKWVGSYRTKESQSAIDFMEEYVGDQLLPSIRESEKYKQAINQRITLEELGYGDLAYPFEVLESRLLECLNQNQTSLPLAV